MLTYDSLMLLLNFFKKIIDQNILVFRHTILAPLSNHVVFYPIRYTISYLGGFGALALVLLIIQFLTGIIRICTVYDVRFHVGQNNIFGFFLTYLNQTVLLLFLIIGVLFGFTLINYYLYQYFKKTEKSFLLFWLSFLLPLSQFGIFIFVTNLLYKPLIIVYQSFQKEFHFFNVDVLAFSNTIYHNRYITIKKFLTDQEIQEGINDSCQYLLNNFSAHLLKRGLDYPSHVSKLNEILLQATDLTHSIRVANNYFTATLDCLQSLNLEPVVTATSLSMWQRLNDLSQAYPMETRILYAALFLLLMNVANSYSSGGSSDFGGFGTSGVHSRPPHSNVDPQSNSVTDMIFQIWQYFTKFY
jgi:hypothetical protein